MTVDFTKLTTVADVDTAIEIVETQLDELVWRKGNIGRSIKTFGDQASVLPTKVDENTMELNNAAAAVANTPPGNEHDFWVKRLDDLTKAKARLENQAENISPVTYIDRACELLQMEARITVVEQLITDLQARKTSLSSQAA